MSSGIVFIDGEFVSPDEARMSIFDYGFTWSDCVYDVTSVWHGWFFKLDEHLDRFERSCAGFRLTNPYSRGEVEKILAECVERAGLDDAYVKVELTRGTTPDQSRDLRLATGMEHTHGKGAYQLHHTAQRWNFCRSTQRRQRHVTLGFGNHCPIDFRNYNPLLGRGWRHRRQ